MKSFILRVIRYLNSLLSFKKILVLGDSHVLVFEHKNFIKKFPFIWFHVCSVGGATASGLTNPNSKTKAFEIFEQFLLINKSKKVIVMLGEVDTGFVIWYRAKKYNVSVEDMFDKAVNNYTTFLKKLSLSRNLLIISTPLPTIDDNSLGDVVNARKEVKTSQLERTALTIKFNSSIEKFCNENNINYLNLDNQSIGLNGLVKNELKNRDLSDHHYDFDKYSNLIIERLIKSFI